jgi:hypothetical protein
MIRLCGSLLVFAILGLFSPAHAEGRDEIIANPHPDRTWTKVAGTLFASSKSVAVVIAVSDYIGERAGGYPRLGSARSDADKMVEFLRDTAGFDTIFLLTNDKATKQRIDHLMTDQIPVAVGPTDRFLFYWSGHGDQMVLADNSRSFGFLPVATSPKKQWSTMISMDDISRWDGYLQARHTLFVLDACLSGLAGVEKKDARDVRLEQLGHSAHQLITAGTDKENVITSDRWQGSLFTDSFIRGATRDANQSFGVVTLYSLIEFIQNRVAVEKVAVNYTSSLTPQIRNLRSGDGAFFFSSKPTVAAVTPPPRGDAPVAPPLQPKGEEPSPKPDVKAQPVQRVAVQSRLVQSIVTNSPVYSPGDTIKIKINAASSRVKAHAIFPFASGERAKAEAKYSTSEGGLYIPYKIPETAVAGIYEATVYLEEINSKAEEKQVVDFEVKK